MSDEFRRKRKLYKMYQYQLVIWLGTWIRTKIDGVRVRCFTLELSPTRWKAKFGRMDVSEARRGQWLEIDRKEIVRRNALALVTPRRGLTFTLRLHCWRPQARPWVRAST